MLLAQKVLDDVIQGCVDGCNYHPELEPPKPPPPPEEPAEPPERVYDDAEDAVDDMGFDSDGFIE